LQASDPSSKLDLSHLTKLTGGGYYSGVHVNALGGGTVDLSNVTSYPGSRTNIFADGAGSIVDLSQLPKLVSDVYYNSSLEARNSATIKIPLLTTLSRVDLAVNANATLATRQITGYTGATLTVNGAAPDFSGLTKIDGLNLYVNGGGTLAFPNVTSYAGAGYDTTLQANGANSKLDLSHLTKLTGGGYYSGVYVNALGGGKVDLSNVTSDLGGRINVLADGTGSIVDLSQLPKMISDVYYNSSLEARNSGTVRVPLVTTLNRVDVAVGAASTLATHQITTFTGATFTVNGAAVDLAGLTNVSGDTVNLNGGSVNLANVTKIDGSSLTVSGGATLSLPAVTSYAGAGYDTTLQASGANSKLDLSHLTKLTGGGYYSGLHVNALAGGTVDLSNITSNPSGRTNVLADGSNSVVDLSRVTTLVSDVYYNSSLEARNSGTVKVPLLTTLNRVDVAVGAAGTLATRQLTTFTGATFTVNGPAVDLTGLTNISGDTINLNGGSVNLANVTKIDGSSLTVSGGATLSLPAVTSYAGAGYDTTLQASGANSKLDLSHLTKLTGGGYYSGMHVNALGGGTVDLSNITSYPGNRTNIFADGAGSIVDLSRLPTLVSDVYYNSSLEARNSGTIKAPLLTTLNRVDITVNANATLATRQLTTFTGATITVNGTAPDFSGLTKIDGCNLYVNGGGTLAFPNVTSYAGAGYDTTLQASDANSKLDLSHLTKLTGGDPYSGLHVNAVGGGKVDLGGVTSDPAGRINVFADGGNSVVDLSQLTKMVSDNYYNSSLEARNSATIKVPLLTALNRVDITINAYATLATRQITTFTGATITVNGAAPDFSGLTKIDGLSLLVTSGGTLAFPNVTSYTGAGYDTTLQASDANSKLDLSHLTTLTGGDPYSGVRVNAIGGGKVDLSGVTSNPGGRINVVADGGNSLVDLSQLPKMTCDNYYNSSLEARNNGTIKVPLLATLSRVDLIVNANATLATRQLTTFTGATITVNGATPDFSSLTNVDGSSLYVNGGTLALPSVTSYTGANYDTTVQANGGNSKLDLSHLTKLTGGNPYSGLHINALGGGTINLSGVTSNPGGRVNILADGGSSVVDLSQLPRMNSDNAYNSSLEVRNSGTIKVPLLATLNRVDVTLDGSNASIGTGWTSFIGGTITVNGGSYTLPRLADFLSSSLNLRGGTVTFAQGTVGTINLSTGLDSSGKLLATGGQPDAHWTVQQANGTTTAAQTVFPNNPDWYNGWPANGPNSDWIARDASTSRQGTTPYTFTRTFDLTGYDLSTVVLAGAWNVDDTGTLAVNGHVIDTQGNPWGGGRFPTFLVAAASGFLNQGVNTLTITITASDNFDTSRRSPA
jgi:hypothetical protein